MTPVHFLLEAGPITTGIGVSYLSLQIQHIALILGMGITVAKVSFAMTSMQVRMVVDLQLLNDLPKLVSFP